MDFLEVKECGVAGCDKKHYGNGYCNKHWQRWKKHGDPEFVGKKAGRAIIECIVEDCFAVLGAKSHKEVCDMHYQRMRKHGSYDLPASSRNNDIAVFYKHNLWPQLALAIKAKTVIGKNDCWIWQGTERPDGYGNIQLGGKQSVAHRISFQAFNNLDELTAESIHHICANRICVNPDHLVATTHRENNIEMMERNFYKNRIAELEEEVAQLKTLLQANEGVL